MNYRNRYLEAKLLRYKDIFPAILVTGARQVGKSTLLLHLFGHEIPCFVFDPVIDVGNAREDPEFFLEQHQPPVILDEIQYAPELLPVIKRRIDQNPAAGQYFLTGSQNLSVLKNISESLAGRIIILDLETMSLGERLGEVQSVPDSGWIERVLNSGKEMPDLSQVNRHKLKSPLSTIFSVLWRGGFPGILDLANDILPDYFRSYVQTYIERDIRTIADVSDQQLFSRFLRLCAALTSQEINLSQLGRDIGVTPQTAQRWLSILKATYQWIEIPPYYGNTIKRISGKPKGHLTDTGLASYLQYISSPEALSANPMLGHFFESHVVLDIKHKFSRLDMAPQVYHWRTHAGAEVDLLLERDSIFWPIEIKCKTNVSKSDTRGIQAFKSTYPFLNIGPGIIIAPVQQVSKLADNIIVIPYDLM